MSLDPRRWRVVLAWALSAALLAGYALLDQGDETTADSTGEGRALLPEEERGREAFDITEIQPTEAVPGSAVAVGYIDTHATHTTQPMRAWLSVTDYRGGRQMPSSELEVIHAGAEHLVVRIPARAFTGRAKLRVGISKDERSKPYDLRIHAISHRKLMREVLGGLALLFFGLRTLARGSRQYTGDRSQGLLAHIGRRAISALGLGVVVGGLTQFTTTAAGLVVGLVESHVLGVAAAVAVLLGAQLGAAVTPSVLGLVSTREGLLVLTIGVLWLTLAADRRSEAFGKIIFGCGLLFFGLYLLRQGFEPLLSNPELLPYIDRFQAGTLAGRLTCVLAGVLLTALLQGPAPVFALVLGLAQTTGRIDLPSGLAILAGTGLGAAVDTLVVAVPFGPNARRVARLHLLCGFAATALLTAFVGPLARASLALLPGNAGEISYGTRIPLPRMGAHLVAGFAIGQVAVTLLGAALLPAILRLGARPGRPALAPGQVGAGRLREGLVAVLALHHEALSAIHDLGLRGLRRRGRDGEHLLADARGRIEALMNGALTNKTSDPELARLRPAALATVQLQRSMEELLMHGERSAEQHLALSPAGEAWKLAPQDAATLEALHGLLVEGLGSLTAQLKEGGAPDIDAARAREIRLNATESKSRHGLLVDADRGETSGMIALRLCSSELVTAYESVGNHLYRLNESLAAEVDQEAARAL